MIPVTQATRTALKQAVKQLRARVTWTNEDQTTGTITSEDSLISIKKDAEGYYFKSTLRKITLVVSGTTTDLLDRQIDALIQVKTGADTWGDIPWGHFFIDEANVDQEKGTTTYIGYGGIARLQKQEYTPGTITYPTTVAGLAQQIADYFGITIDTDMTTLPNHDAPIAEDLWEKINGTTYRDILEEIAGATATIAVIGGGDDTLDFLLPPIAAPTETLTEANLISSKVGENFGAVNAVVLSRQPQQDNIEVIDPNASVRHDLTIVNNQILDKQRETTAQPILDAVDGWEYREGAIKTEGHAYHEIGDRIDVLIGGQLHTLIVTKSTILVDGGINETLTSITPDVVDINYSKTGGITKTIYNTELAVDKQEQRIDAIVSRQDITDERVQEQFTQVTQTINNLTVSVQTTGGGNLIKNSVGYSKDSDDNLVGWSFAGTGSFMAQANTESLQAGAVSGSAISALNGTLTQRLSVAVGQTYCLSYIAKKGTTGSAGVILQNTADTFSLLIPDQTSAYWVKKSLVFTPTVGYVDVIITSDSTVTDFSITDLMISQGDMATVWRQADGEILNTQVAVDTEGVRVKSSVYDGDETIMTPLEFAGFSSVSGRREKVFSLNRDTTEVKKIEAEQQITMPPLKIIPLDNPSGWAFVKQEGA